MGWHSLSLSPFPRLCSSSLALPLASGTMRSLTHAGYRYIDERVKEIFKGAAATGGCKVNVTTTSLEKDCLSSAPPEGAPGPCTFPPTVNSPDAYRVAKGAAVGLVGSERFIEATPTMGGEDFAYLLEQVPGAMVFLGIGNATKHTNVNLHNPRCAHLARHTHTHTMGAGGDTWPLPHLGADAWTNCHLERRFQMDESVMHLGASLHVEMALRSLAAPSGGKRCLGSSTAGDGDGQAQCGEGTAMEGED